MIKNQLLSLLASIMLLVGCTGKKSADLVLINGNIYTEDEKHPHAEAIAVKDGKIVFIGNSKDANDYVGDKTEVTDLQGKTVMPSFIDSHTHPGLIAFSEPPSGKMPAMELPLGSKEEMFAYLRNIAQKYPELPFLMIGDWNETWYAPKGPHKKDLDEIFPKTPVILLGRSGHSFWLNTAAMNMLGITENTPDLKKDLSFFERDENGKMTGWVKEFALFPYLDKFVKKDNIYLEKGLTKYLNYVASTGVTTVLDAGNFQFEEMVYKVVQKMEKEGKLPLRYEATHHIYRPDQLKNAVQVVLELRKKYQGDLLKINTIKIHLDGVNEINTAGVLEDFSNEKGNKGGVLFNEDELKTLLLDCAKNKVHLHLHTNSDRSIRTGLNAWEKAKKEYGGQLPIQLTLSHLEVVHPDDMKRFKQPGVYANFTPQWVSGALSDGGLVALGKERYAHSWPINSLIKAGATVTISSDVINSRTYTRSNPFFGIQVGATRQEPELGSKTPVFGQEEDRAPVKDLIKGYTINNAKQMGIADETGSLEIGKSADFIILPSDIFRMNRYEISKIIPTAVYFKGNKVKK